MLKRLWAWLGGMFQRAGRSPRGQKYDPDFGFPPIDLDKAARDLELREKAVSNGLNELPPSDSAQLDGPQHSVVHFVKGEVSHVTTAFETKIAGLNRQITRQDVRQLIHGVSNADQDLDHELLAIRDELQPRLADARGKLDSVERDYTAFRAGHALSREPRYPTSHFLHVAVIIGVLVGEAVINAVFFERGNPHGLVGGAVFALVLAAVDVGIVFSLGRVSAWATSNSPVHKTWGVLALAFFFVWAGVYNLLVAHIREALRVDPDRAAQLALQTFSDGMFGLTQADSWVLLAVGILFSILAMLDGFNWTDRFPGYATLHKALQLARREVQFLESELVQRATTTREASLAKLHEALRDGDNGLKTMRNDIEAKKLLLTNVRTFVGHHEDTCNALIAIYRDENQKARKTAPPKYFNTKWQLPIPQTFTDDTDADLERLSECHESLAALGGRADELRKSIRDRYDEFRTKYTPGYEKD